jgi:hypothetical protein
MNHHRTRRLLVAGVLAAAGLALAACNQGGGTASAPTQTVTVGADGQAESTASDDSGDPNQAGGTLPADWPDENFPVPPGVDVTARGSGAETGILLVGKSPEEVTSFYRSALPAAGYKITKDSSVGAGQVQVVGLEFSGNGYSGKIAVVNQTVSISIHEG